jgi:membrane protein implicated in regulation of membrane protease activity
MITFPKADVIPFGEHGDKLGMTRYEILQMMHNNNGYFGDAMELFLTMLFGYIVAMYLAAPKLSRTQYTIANTVFLVVMANQILFTYRAIVTSNQWDNFDGTYGPEVSSFFYEMFPVWLATVNTLLQFFLLITLPMLAVWFGWRIRKNPPQDRLNLP